MKLYLLLSISLTSLCLQTAALAQTESPEMIADNPFLGAWLISETTITDADGVTSFNSSPSTGLYVFSDRHFSTMLVPGEMREPFYLREHSDAEKLAAYDNFSADAGSYVYDETSITTQHMLAKIPDFERTGMHYQWRMDGEELILEFSDGWAPAGGQIIYRLTRLE